MFGNEIQLTNNLVNICVISYRSDAKIAYYTISITSRSNKTWILEKRYSQFEELDIQLRVLFNNELPNLPRKKLITFFVGKTNLELEQRRRLLDSYLKQLVVRLEVFNSEPLKEFLEIEKNQGELVIKVPEQNFQFEPFLFGVRDFIFAKDQGLLFVLNSDMNILTRFDSYLVNMKLPWENDEANNEELKLAPVGRLDCFIKNSKEANYENVWSKSYNTQAICMYWDPIELNLFIGLDSGIINFLKVSNQEPKYTRYVTSLEIEMHKLRVMGLYFDTQKQTVHSVSKDKRYRVFNLATTILVGDLQPSDNELTCLQISRERQKSFVGDRKGQIFIFDITNAQPVPIVSLQTNISFIRSMAIDPVRNYLIVLGFNNGDIEVFDINKDGSERNTRRITQMRNKEGSRCLVWSQKRGELMIGCKDGTVQIWDAKKQSPLYVMKAHDSDITQITWLEKENMLMTGSKDKLIKVWKFPNQWRDKELEQKEFEEEYIRIKTLSMIEIHKQKPSQEEDDDDLQNWNKEFDLQEETNTYIVEKELL